MRPDLLICALLAAGPVWGAPKFVERAAGLGITHSYDGGWEHFVGGGVAVADCDGDALPELFVAGGENPSVLLRNRSGVGGQLDFVEATPDTLSMKGVIGAYPLDVDSDGYQDLFILRVGENRLLKGGPDCSFQPFTDIGFTSDDRWTTAFSATWEEGQALPTLAVGNYVDRGNPDGPFEACDINQLYRPSGDAYVAPMVLEPGFCPLSALFSDWGRSGRADLRLSNDRHYYVRGGEEQMWAMESAPRLYGAVDGWRSFKLWGMGIASRDISGDGVPEVYLSSMGDQKLQSLEAGSQGPSFVDATYERGTTAHRPYTGGDGRPSTGWHTAFGDVQNDGRDDLFVAKGNVEMMPDSAQDDPNNLMIQQEDGRFVEVGDTAGIASLVRGRGAALEDLNLDGRLDLVVVNRRAPLEIYENVTEGAGNWLLLRLERDGANRDAVGAWIEVDTGTRTYSREITVGGGHASGAIGYVHFGLGAASVVDVRVIWPDGTQSEHKGLAANQRLDLSKG